MPEVSLFADFFKPEIRSSGQEIFLAEKVWISIGSDTRIEALVRTGTGFKVVLTSVSISAPTFAAKCTCSASDRGSFCKHIWAVLLATAKKHPDFLDSKTAVSSLPPKVKEPTPFALKQAEYKRLQNENQRLRAKEYRQRLKLKMKTPPPLPEKVQWALDYFSENGVEITVPLTESALRSARNQVAKKVHPDLGGEHERIVTLNRNFEILMAFVVFERTKHRPALRPE
jgi:hypothetical protein